MRTSRSDDWAGSVIPLPGFEDPDFGWIDDDWHRREPPAGRGRSTRATSLSGVVSIAHDGREYAARYEQRGDLLTVYCGPASNTSVMPASAPSPKPLAERLLRELIDAEHPGLNPA